MAEQPDKGDLAGGRCRPSWRDHALFWSVAGGGLGLDLGTKAAVFHWLGGTGGVQVVPGFLRLICVLNDGAAFSLAAGRRSVLVAVSLAALAGIVGLFLAGGRRPVLSTAALGLFAGGVMGNLWDRLFNHGQVRDFIDMYVGRHHWPTFNVADILLCVAVGLLFIEALTTGRNASRPRP